MNVVETKTVYKISVSGYGIRHRCRKPKDFTHDAGHAKTLEINEEMVQAFIKQLKEAYKEVRRAKITITEMKMEKDENGLVMASFTPGFTGEVERDFLPEELNFDC